MRRLSIGLAFIFSILSGCQSVGIEEVVHEHGDIQNLEAFDAFVEHVENNDEDEINFVNYGVEGQRGVYTLAFDGDQIHVSLSVDGDFINEYNCEAIKIEEEEEIQRYILQQCSGNYTGDFELLTIADHDN